MLKVVDENTIEEVINFSWEVAKNVIHTSYPLRKSKLELEKSLRKSMDHAEDKVLGYYKNDNLMGVIELFVEVTERYLQVRTYVKDDFDEIMNELLIYLKAYYPNFKAHFGYPKENIKAINYFTVNQYSCIEASSDLRLCTNDFVFKRDIKSAVQRLQKDNFSQYAPFHDQHGGEQMYWNSARLYNAFDSWYIYVYMSGSEIVGSILIYCKPKLDCIEVFGLFVEEIPNQYEVIEDLLYHSISKILGRETGIKEVIFFIEEKDTIQYEIAKQIGFKDKGSYRCYSIDL